jgi:DNA polymerase I-like protein with 3'-5' exonuclease and polymerase domains
MPALFDIGTSRLNVNDAELISKTKKSKPKSNKKGTDLISKIAEADAFINQYLGKYLQYMEVISDEQRLSEYIDHAISNGIIAIDTETTGLDPLVDKVVGVGIYTYDETWAYIPVEHISYVTGQRAKHQLESELVGSILKRLEDAGTKIVMFNATFDIRMIKNSLGVRLHCWWDCYLAARLLNDNEPSNALKKLYQKYILRGESNAFTFEEVFGKMSFQNIPIKTAYPYAAYDPKVTLDYYDYQSKYLYYDPACTMDDRNGMNGVSWVFFNIEMPCVDATVELEDTGIEFDFEYNEKLKVKYHKLLDDKEKYFHKLCEEYRDEIEDYQGDTRFDNPININSVPQLQALLYDIIGLECQIDKKTKKPTRSTGEDVLKKLKHPVADAILAYREFSTIVGTFIDKLPECVNKKDRRIHCKFNQYGADTGRFSSENPNMQNIPSHNKDIRKMFKAHSEEYIVSTDTDYLELKRFTEVETPDGWVYSDKLKIDDELLVVDDDGESVYSIDDIKVLPDKVIIKLFDCSQ